MASAAAGAAVPGAAGAHAIALASEAKSSVTDCVPFHGPHQAGITTPAQRHTYFMAFDLEDEARRADLVRLLQDWTRDAAELTRGGRPRTRPVAGDSGC